MISAENVRCVWSDRVTIHAWDIHLKRHRFINQISSNASNIFHLRDFISIIFLNRTLELIVRDFKFWDFQFLLLFSFVFNILKNRY